MAVFVRHIPRFGALKPLARRAKMASLVRQNPQFGAPVLERIGGAKTAARPEPAIVAEMTAEIAVVVLVVVTAAPRPRATG